MTRARRIGGLLAAAVAVASFAPRARAERSAGEVVAPRVVVVIDGAGADAVRADVRAAMPAELAVGDDDALAAAWQRDGGAGPPALPPRRGVDARTRAAALARLKRAARAAHVEAVVLVTATAPVRGSSRVRVVVVATAEDEPRVDDAITIGPRGRVAALRALLVDATRGLEPAPNASAPAAPPSVPAAAPSAPAPALEHDAPTAPARDARRSLVDVAAGMEVGARDFRYTSRVTQNLRDYSLGAAPLVVASGAVYPFVASAHALPDIGVVGTFAQAVGVSSATSSGTTVATRWSRYSVGGLLRLRFDGVADGAVVRVSGVYGEEAFAFDQAASGLDAQLPAVTYRFVRPYVDARIELGRAAAFAGVGYLAVLSGGAVADRFPSASVAGVEASLGGAFAIVRGLELRATVDYRRFFYALHPVPGATYVAGGALDQLAGAQLALAYTR